MMMDLLQKRKVAWLLLFPCMVSFQLLAQKVNLEADGAVLKKYMKTITAEELKDHLYILASDDFEGRETGTKGQAMAAAYVSRHFLKNGLEGPMKDNPNPFYQTIPFRSSSVTNAQMGNANYEAVFQQEFIPSSSFSLETSTKELVFLGYGVEKENYNDFEGIDIEGKGVVLLSGVPTDKKGEPLFEDLGRMRSRVNELRKKGAAFVVTTYSTEEEFQTRFSFWGRMASKPRISMVEGNDNGSGRQGFPQFLVSPSALAKMFGEEPARFFKNIEKNNKKEQPLGGLYATTVELAVDYSSRKVTSDNILGFFEGSEKSDEIIVVSSHYDHVGINGGEVYNGADDDGSGTVGLLEVVNAFANAAKDGIRPKRSILFLAVTGEEKGLLGSRYYTDNPVYPLDKTITNLNIDMIGRVDPEHESDPDYVYIIGSTMLSSTLHAVHEAVSSTYLPGLKMDYKYNDKDDPNRFYYRSDHYNFAKNNIPVIFYFNGTHADYHKATDTPDKINYELLAKRAQLVFATAWELANRGEKPVVDQSSDE
jgi:hypothetical protein